jgi:hypothetical protein
MALEKIISVSGKSGLYELKLQTKSSFLVKDLETGKGMSLSAQNNVIMLSNVAIFTDQEDKPLQEILVAIYKKENGGASINFKAEAADLFEYFAELVPNFDKKRVYHSDLKKIFKWYAILHKADLLTSLVESNKEEEIAIEEITEPEKPEKKADKKAPKKAKKDE